MAYDPGEDTGRATEVGAALPDGVLLLKALDAPLQQVSAIDAQASFPLAQSRVHLALDEKPTQESLRAFSQCLLAEAETLVLLQTSSPTGTMSTPLKIKQLDGPNPSPTKSTPDTKTKTSSTADQPCKFFISDGDCKAGKSCKWLHSWDNVLDKASRCWLCGGKDHRKQDCKLRSTKSTKNEPSGSGAGRGGHNGRGGQHGSLNANATSTPVGGKAGAAATSTSKSTASTPTPGISEISTSGGDGKGSGGSSQPEVTTSSSTVPDKGSDKANAGDLLNEAAQLLKSLRLNPKLKAMRLDKVSGPVLDQDEKAWILLD